MGCVCRSFLSCSSLCLVGSLEDIHWVVFKPVLFLPWQCTYVRSPAERWTFTPAWGQVHVRSSPRIYLYNFASIFPSVLLFPTISQFLPLNIIPTACKLLPTMPSWPGDKRWKVYSQHGGRISLVAAKRVLLMEGSLLSTEECWSRGIATMRFLTVSFLHRSPGLHRWPTHKSPGGSELLLCAANEGHCAYRDIQSSRVSFVPFSRSPPSHNLVSELFR